MNEDAFLDSYWESLTEIPEYDPGPDFDDFGPEDYEPNPYDGTYSEE